jgi:hypothetical protein
MVRSVSSKLTQSNNMKTRKYFKIRSREDDPQVIIRKDNRHTEYTFETVYKPGQFYRVHPCVGDHEAMLLIQHRVDKFAPAVGNGVIIRAETLKQFDAQ